MKGYVFGLALVIALGVLALPMPALATNMGADPGFSYVDVDNDGTYDTAKDIGLLSTPPVDIDALIAADGQFDTSQSEGNYHAPCYPVSLVISKTRGGHPWGLPSNTLPICLKAGVDLTIYGAISTTQSINLQACRNVVLTQLSAYSFGTKMTVSAGQDVIMDGAAITGDPAKQSQLYVSACRNISAQQVSGIPSAMTTGSVVNLCANGAITLDDAQVATDQPGASISLNAGGALDAVNGTNISTTDTSGVQGGDVCIQSQCSLVDLESDLISGKTLQVEAYTSADVSSSIITTSGATTIQANGPVYGNSASTAIDSSCLQVNSCNTVDLSSSNIFVTTGSIEVTGKSDVSADNVTWNAVTEIEVTSNCGNIDAQSAHMTMAPPTNPIEFYAGGGLIDVQGSVFVGTVSYQPNGVTVIGPL